MALKTPAWWYKKNAKAPKWRWLLRPFAALWRLVNDFKSQHTKAYRSSLYVISVGNVTVGGSGKTPVTAEILRLLSDRRAVGLSRGYGGTHKGPVWVNPMLHTAAEIGDEPLMLAQDSAFMVARDRAEGLKALERTETRIAVLDDAHQNPKIVKDLHILVIDGDTRDGVWPFGNGSIFPYGPMREPLAKGLARADLIVLWLPDETVEADPALLPLLGEKPVYVARMHAHKPDGARRVVGYAGIAKPWKFEATLKAQGFDLLSFRGFPDHVSPPERVLKAMLSEAQSQDAQLITTQKDWVRLPPLWRRRVTCLPISARFDDETGFAEVLRAKCGKPEDIRPVRALK